MLVQADDLIKVDGGVEVQCKLICFEDEHLLVVNKPTGMATHSPSPYSGEGLYEWLRHREPRWGDLAIIHRLDKETSGLLVFGKTRLANRELTKQFSNHTIQKKYRFVTDHPVKPGEFTIVSAIVRSGEKYVSRPLHAGGEMAATRFRALSSEQGRTLLEAQPITGRTHQIRVQASSRGFPILGDTLYGGTAAARLCLHAHELSLKHPATGAQTNFYSPVDFDVDPRMLLRAALIEPACTDAYRIAHGAADGWPGLYVDRLGDFLLSQGVAWPSSDQEQALAQWKEQSSLAGVYHKILNRRVREATAETASPRWVLGRPAPEKFLAREHGLQFELSFQEGYSCGLFLDQRENRRRFFVNYVGADFTLFDEGAQDQEILNTFAYTCGYSVCAAKAGGRVTSLDLSRKYLEWGKRNFTANGLDPGEHEFIYGDAFNWLKRLQRSGRKFHAIILDPPTFSTSKAHGVFRVEQDYPTLMELALPLLRSNGVVFASANTSKLPAEQFLKSMASAIQRSGRTIVHQHYVPQPPDFPISRAEPAYLKSVWLRVS